MSSATKVGIGVAAGLAIYLLYKNWQMLIGAAKNQSMGGFDFGVLDPSSWSGSEGTG